MNGETAVAIEAAVNAAYGTLLKAIAAGESDERVADLRVRFVRLQRVMNCRRTTQRMLAPVLA